MNVKLCFRSNPFIELRNNADGKLIQFGDGYLIYVSFHDQKYHDGGGQYYGFTVDASFSVNVLKNSRYLNKEKILNGCDFSCDFSYEQQEGGLFLAGKDDIGHLWKIELKYMETEEDFPQKGIVEGNIIVPTPEQICRILEGEAFQKILAECKENTRIILEKELRADAEFGKKARIVLQEILKINDDAGQNSRVKVRGLINDLLSN